MLFHHCIDFNYHLGSSAFNQRTYFSISCKMGRWVTLVKVFLFLLIWNASILPSFLRDCFPGYKSWLSVFFLQHFKYMIPQHSGLTCSDGTSVLILIGSLIPYNVICSCCFEDFFLCLLAVLILCVSVWIWIYLFLDL